VSIGDDKITPDDVIVNTLLHFSTSLHKHFVDGNKNPIEALKVYRFVFHQPQMNTSQ
jgi:hypothetical protein